MLYSTVEQGVLFKKLQKVNPCNTWSLFFNKFRYLLFFLKAAETERKSSLETIMDNSIKMVF